MTKFEMAMQFIELTGAKETIVAQMKATLDQMMKIFDKSPLSAFAPSKADLAEFMGRAERSTPEIIHRIAIIYTEHFSEEELKGMLEFYSSPLGKSMMSKLPVVMAASQVAGAAWAKKFTQDATAAFMQ